MQVEVAISALAGVMWRGFLPHEDPPGVGPAPSLWLSPLRQVSASRAAESMGASQRSVLDPAPSLWLSPLRQVSASRAAESPGHPSGRCWILCRLYDASKH